MHRVQKRDLRLGTEPHTLRLLAGVDDVDARMGAAAGRERDGDEPPLHLLLAHGHGSSDTAGVQSRQPVALNLGSECLWVRERSFFRFWYSERVPSPVWSQRLLPYSIITASYLLVCFACSLTANQRNHVTVLPLYFNLSCARALELIPKLIHSLPPSLHSTGTMDPLSPAPGEPLPAIEAPLPVDPQACNILDTLIVANATNPLCFFRHAPYRSAGKLGAGAATCTCTSIGRATIAAEPPACGRECFTAAAPFNRAER
jgi:hypothetical protein